MKKENKIKAFTLVELLTVIVILAVIALIAVPKILGIINNTKFKKYKIEEEYMKEAAKLYYTSNNMDEYEPVDLQTLVDNNFTNPVVDSGNGGYCKGKVIEDEKGVLKGCLKCSNYITKGCGYTEDDPDDKPVEEPDEPVIIDANPGIICGDKKEEEYDSMTECHIKSVEDLVEFTKMVNDEKHTYTFLNKIVYLDKNLDIKNYEKGKSYLNADALADFDINGDGDVTSLKDEMTTDKGFLPIGTKSHSFAGTFEGNAYTIKNLMINRPDVDNVGLFGYAYYAEIKGFNLENVNITGNNNVGGVAGYSYTGKVKEITLSGNITGHDYVGGITGHYANGANSISVILNANITGNDHVYGISDSNSNSKGVVESGTITGNLNVYGGSSSSSSSLVNEKVIIDAPEDAITLGGTLYKDTTYGDLNLYDTPNNASIIDTYLGGDNDSSGYYFDYNKNGKLVIKSTKKDPLDYTLQGEGTKEDPYLIYTYEDYKKIALMPTEANYYKLMADIDFTNKKYYMIGTYAYNFKGNFDGNVHTLKNMELEGYNYVGLFGYLDGGEMKGFNIKNINVLGQNDYVGGVAGYSYTGKVKEITLSGNITGHDYVGGITGHYANGANSISVILNANITGNDHVYGISDSNSNSKGVVESGTITGNLNVYGGSSSSSSSLVNEKVIIDAPEDAITLGGTLYKDTTYGDLNLYDTPNNASIIDTYLGGDNDSSGYYFDYNKNGKLVIKSTKKDPLDYTLQGEGTKEDPYLIYTYEDYKKIALMPTEANYYKLMADIDFTNKKYYMIGTYAYNFKGNFDGNVHTLKNMELEGYNYVGLFGYLDGGEMKGFNIKNINVIGQNDYVGGITGYSYNPSSVIKEITLSGNITGHNSVGGIAGSTGNGAVVSSVIVNANVTGNTYVYGISYNGTGVIESGTIKGNSSVYGGFGWGSTAFVNKKVKIESESTPNVGGTLYEDTIYGNLNLYDTLDKTNIIDTYLGGDNDSSGYYFDYNKNGKLVIKSTEKDPIDYTLQGEGTEETPYLIYTYEDYKKIALMPTETNYYKLMADIDFTNKKYYMIGTNAYRFKGNFDGNAYTLKNMELEGYKYVGLFGYMDSSSEIKGFNVENINVLGQNDYVGGIAGECYSSQVKEITLSGNITGNNRVGGIVGHNEGSTTSIASVIVNANVTGNTYVYGISYNGTGVIESGTIKGNSSVYGGFGWGSTAFVNEKVKIEATGTPSLGGKRFPENHYNVLSEYALLKNSSNYIIDTPYSGDTDNSGYWFDYNDYGDDIIVVKAGSAATNPNVNPNNPGETSEPTIVHEKTTNPDKPFPECKVTRFDTYGRGFTASYSCTDAESIVEIKHIYWVKADVDDYDSLVEWKNITPGPSTSYSSVWTESSAAGQGITPPYPGNCYYFYYGAKNQAGNERIYRTGYCLSY